MAESPGSPGSPGPPGAPLGAGFRWVSFTTDYGASDGFVAICKGVLATIAPDVTVIDVSHQVPPQDVRRGAAVLAQAVPWLPPAVHLAVVDPGVGTDRRGIAVVTPRGILVGPDNGLLVPAAGALGAATAAYALTERAFWLPEVSGTFHGRDVFAPVAAHLCRGIQPARLGPAVPPDQLHRLPAPEVAVTAGALRAEVLSIDAFGNVQLAATAADLAAAGLRTRATVRIGATARPAAVGRTFADTEPGGLVVLADSAGQVAIAVNGGSAAAELGASDGDLVTVQTG
ncbi:MAG: S-adenosyl-l-methionine hydroxide adenosyltransferase family protein [Mycobacteriales bacterium]